MREETIGSARLILGDCRDVLPELSGVDAVVTDPPYAISVAGMSHVGRLGKGTRKLDFFAGDSDWQGMNETVSDAVTKAMTLRPLSFAVWCSHRQIGFISTLLESADYKTKPMFWRKKCPPPAPPGSGFSSAIEMCVYGYVSGRPWFGSDYDVNVFEADSYRHGQPDKVDHPTQKPLQLMQWQIERITAPSSTVLDPFMGSGTTGVACARLGRSFIGIECEPKYFDIACKRIDNAYKQRDLFIDAQACNARPSQLSLLQEGV